jgi:hypothetical protein
LLSHTVEDRAALAGALLNSQGHETPSFGPQATVLFTKCICLTLTYCGWASRVKLAASTATRWNQNITQMRSVIVSQAPDGLQQDIGWRQTRLVTATRAPWRAAGCGMISAGGFTLSHCSNINVLNQFISTVFITIVT